LNRRESDKALLALILERFDQPKRWSSELAHGDG